jgi:chaperonin GroES
MSLQPMNGHVILRPIEEGETTYGNIVLPDLGKEKPEMGEVVAASDTYNWHTGAYYPSHLKVGDKVLIPKLGSMKITVEGEDYYITKETEVLAKFENHITDK